MLELCRITKKFGTITVADNLSYAFLPGTSYAIMGPSGTGKSTLLYMLAGLDQPTEGHVAFGARTISEDALKNRALYESFLLRSLGLVFQTPCLVPELSVLENIGIKGLIMGMSYEEMKKQALDVLHKVGLNDVINQPVTVLSGGQQQRVAVARALFLLPKFLLLDEPTAHVDVSTAQEIIALLTHIKKTENIGCIVVSHDPLVAQAMDCVLYMRDGKLHEQERE